MSLSMMTRTSTSSSSSPSNLSSGAQVLPSFAQTFSSLAGGRTPPENNSQPISHSHSHSHGHSRHSNTNNVDSSTAAERDYRDRDRDRERDRCRTEHRPRQSIHEKDTTLPPIFSHQGPDKKRTHDDMRLDDNREREYDPGREWNDRGKDQVEGRSPPQSSHIKREPSVSPSPEHFPQQQQRYHQSHPNAHPPYPSHSASQKRRKSNYEYPLSPVHPSFPNERDSEHTYCDTYPRRGSVAGLAQSNPSSASSSSSSSAHSHSQRPNPPMRRLSAMGNRTGSLSPQQPSHGLHPQNPAISVENSSRSPNQASLPPPLPTSKSPSQAHFHQSSSQQTQPQSSLPSSHFTMALPAPPISFSTSRKRRLNAQSQGDISVPVPRPIITGSGIAATSTAVVTATSGSGPGSTTTPGSASGPCPTSASGVNAIGTNTDPGSSTPSLPRGPPRHLTIAPQSHTKRLEPLIHSAPVNGGFFRDSRDMKASGVSGITISGVGISSVHLRAGHSIGDHTSTLTSTSTPSSFLPGPGSSNNTSASGSGGITHPPVTPMRIPELPLIPITPGGRKNTTYQSHNHSSSLHTPQSGHPNVLWQQQRQYVRTAPPHSAGFPLRNDKESADLPFIVGDRLILDRERLEKDRERFLADRDRSDRDRGANVPIAKNGGMRSGIVLGSVNVPRTPLFSSFVQQNNGTIGAGSRSQQGRSVSASNPPPPSSSKYLQVPHTAGLVISSKSHVPLTPTTGHAPLSHTTGLSSSSAPTLSEIASTLVSSGSTSQSKLSDPKAAFLTPFSDFYDSLADSKLLKSWLHEQLLKSNTLIEQLEKVANGRMNNSGNTSIVVSSSDADTAVTLTTAQLDDMIERRLGPVKNEMEGLRRRVGELEEMVYEARKGGWGRDAEAGKERRPREKMDASSLPNITPLPSLRSSPPPPLLLTTAQSSDLETSASASLSIHNPNSSPHAQGSTEAVSKDVEMQDVGRSNGEKVGEDLETTTRIQLPSRSQSQSPPRTRMRTRGDESKGRKSSLTEQVSLSRPTSKSPLSTSVTELPENSAVKYEGTGRGDGMNTNPRVNGSEIHKDVPIMTSVSEHRISAVRFEG